ncbi:hypothetical protein M9H77_02823 [Catharanthus roseus]|uniref:Uncharacterized protein n=1 Tax=Catharanthus roseus TaxID=4058 RepID=A0ACC0C9N9_CATRO|nr:hypothetical protein M9H77_02823 [Catharanthus roseus]
MTSQHSPSTIQTPNRFQALSDFPPLTYSMAAETPSFKLQPKNPTTPIPSTQNTSSTSTQYFTKPLTTSLMLTSFTEVPEFKVLQNFLQRLFPRDCQWLPDDPTKTQTYYELILIDSNSVEITHTPDKTNPQKIAYSKCTIKKVIKSTEWASTPMYLYHSCDEDIEIMFKFYLPQAVKIHKSFNEYQARVEQPDYI